MDKKRRYIEKIDAQIERGKIACPVANVLNLLQGKWKLLVIYELCVRSPMRFGELKRKAEGITNTMLTSVLKELERDGLVIREQFNEIPPHTEYRPSERASELLPIFYEMAKWGVKHAGKENG